MVWSIALRRRKGRTDEYSESVDPSQSHHPSACLHASWLPLCEQSVHRRKATGNSAQNAAQKHTLRAKGACRQEDTRPKVDLCRQKAKVCSGEGCLQEDTLCLP